jgi:outer membrane receptor protein involved in Fe transport
MKRFVLWTFSVICFLNINNFLFAQHTGQGTYPGSGDGAPTGTVKGVIINSTTSEPLGYAYVVLFKVIDSSMVSGGMTDTTGTYKLDKIPFGKYYLAINLIGHKPLKISSIMINPKNLTRVVDTIRLDPTTATLNAVEITSKKDVVEYTLDKKVINVEKNLVSAGGSAVDVMQSIPSVTVDIDGQISMRGSANVTVLVDGKPSGLTGMSRSAILEQIPASSIESIEIISNPSAKYDPEGMSGIINIVLKKKKERGYNGIFSVNAGTGDKYNTSISLNYSKKKFNIFGGYDFRLNNSHGYNDMFRTTTLGDTLAYLEQHGISNRRSHSHNIKFGADYYFNDKNSVTVSAIYGLSDNTDHDITKSTTLNNEKLFSSYYESNETETGDDNSLDLLMSYRKKFAKKGETLNFDVAYSNGLGSEINDQNLLYYYPDFTPDGNPYLQKTTTDDKSNVSTFQLDYSNPLSKTSKVEFGAKSTIRSMDNDYKYETFNDSLQTWYNDPLYSNHFLYDEQIHALYGTYSNSFGNFEFQAGLRAEQALTKSTQKTMNTEFKKDYFSLFPSLHLNYKLKSDNSIQLSYSRRVNRPNYHSLNPFKDVSSPGIIRTGNPFLTPEYIDSYEIGHLKYWGKTSLNSSVFYKQINDAIQRYVTIDTNGIQIASVKNISAGISYGLEFVLQQDFAKWWKVNATFSYFKTIMKGSEEGDELSNSNYSWTAKLNSNMTVLKNLDIQITGNYRAPMVQLQGTMKAMFSSDMAMKKDILKNKASITLRVKDIFNTQKFDMEHTGSNFTLDMTRKRDSRTVFIGFTYKINGGTKTKEKKKPSDNTNDNNDINDF